MRYPFSRRSALRALAAGSVLVAVTACGGPAPSAAAPTGAPGAFPVTIKSEYGTATIPAPPQRVVSAGFNEADFLLAFGVVPVGVRDFVGDFPEETRPWAQQALGGAKPVDIGGQDIDIEKVAATRPDLIMGLYSFIEKPVYDKLAAIAPTVGPVNSSGNISWQDQTTITGQALGQSDKAKTIVADTEKKFAAARAAHPEWAGKKLAVLLVNDGSQSVLTSDDPRAQFFTQLGFARPSYEGDLSPEQLGLLDQDVLVVMGPTKEEMARNPLFQRLNVVRDGRTVYVGSFASPFAGALGFNSPLSLPYAIDLITPRLAAATDGNPANSTD